MRERAQICAAEGESRNSQAKGSDSDVTLENIYVPKKSIFQVKGQRQTGISYADIPICLFFVRVTMGKDIMNKWNKFKEDQIWS